MNQFVSASVDHGKQYDNNVVVTCSTCLYLEPNVMMKMKEKNVFVSCAYN